MLHVDASLCRACGQCVNVCPAHVLVRDPGTGQPTPTADFDAICLRCAHCLMVCAPQAIRAGDLSYENDLFALAGEVPDAAAFEALLASRRSVRRFTDQPVDRAELETIARLVSLAPMGFPPHKAELTMVTDRALLTAVVPEVQAWYAGFLKVLRRPLARWLLRRSMPASDWNTIAGHVEPLLNHVNATVAEGFDHLLHGAPALILVHAHRDAPDHVNDAVIAVTYTFLAAHAVGLGAAVIGLVPPAVNRLKGLRERFGLAADQHVVGAVIVGHPAVAFRRGVRRAMTVHWR